MFKKEDYRLQIKGFDIDKITEFCFEKVFRHDFKQPGFVVLDFGSELKSETLRKYMIQLKRRLNTKVRAKFGMTLNYLWLGRFDQQCSTKYHLDNAGNQSFLMLGYEPSEIKSELYFADYVKFSREKKISDLEFFEKFNPIYADNESLLKPYVTKVEPFNTTSYKLILINNSNTTQNNGSFGVLHMARIIKGDANKSRIINSTMICMEHAETSSKFGIKAEDEFIMTNKISK